MLIERWGLAIIGPKIYVIKQLGSMPLFAWSVSVLN